MSEIDDWMRKDWDARAREDAYYYIVTNAAGSMEEFDASAQLNMADLFDDLWPMLQRTDVMLEIGCGVGRLLRPFAARFKKVYGCDISPEMYRRSKEYLADLPNVLTWINDGRTLAPIVDSSIDLVICYIVFQHIPDREAIASYMSEVARVLRPGGLFRFQVPCIEDTAAAIEAERQRDKTTWVGTLMAESEAVTMVETAGLAVELLRKVPAHFESLWVTARKP